MRTTVWCAVSLLALVLPAPARAQSQRLRISPANVLGACQELEGLGFDVAGIDLEQQVLDVVGGPAAAQQLAARGYRPSLVATSTDFASLAPALGDPGDIPVGYQTPAQIVALLQGFAASYPAICALHDLTAEYGFPSGTYGGRPILALKISDHVAQDEDEPNVLFVACHHAREINTCEVVLDHINRLLTGYGVNPQITSWIDGHEIWLVPVWNTDGQNYVWTTNNMWRKNRHSFGATVGVDLNRNYPLGWNGGCPGATAPSNDTYRGPSAASEIETQVMLNFAADRRFSKLIDFHSYGRQVLYTYLCSSFPAVVDNWYATEATALATACNYAGATRKSSAEGEHYQFELNRYGTFAFLIEIGTNFQPAYSEVTTEKSNTWGAVAWMMNRVVPLAGHLRDACTGRGVDATWTVAGINYTQGEVRGAEPRFGRYQEYLPPGTYTFTFSKAGYQPATRTVSIGALPTLLDVNLVPDLALNVPATAAIGTVATLTASAALDAGHGYVIVSGASGTSPGFPVGSCIIPINYDFVTELALGGGPPFVNFTGALSATGAATAMLGVPAEPLIVGFGLDFALATVPSLAPVLIRTQTQASHLTFVP